MLNGDWQGDVIKFIGTEQIPYMINVLIINLTL